VCATAGEHTQPHQGIHTIFQGKNFPTTHLLLRECLAYESGRAAGSEIESLSFQAQVTLEESLSRISRRRFLIAGAGAVAVATAGAGYLLKNQLYSPIESSPLHTTTTPTATMTSPRLTQTPTPSPTPTQSPTATPISPSAKYQKIFEDFNTISPELAGEVKKLPDLNDIDERDLLALENILFLARKPDYRATFESMLNEGIKDKRKYCAPLEALLWLAYDQTFSDSSDPLLFCTLSCLIPKAWQSSSTSDN